MDWFKLAYTVIGGLGLFLFGMKSLSEGLQSVASDVIRKAINLITRNRVFAVIVGVVVTSFVQSSSISTVMMTGLVNAGLMNLKQAIGFIFGANIGTTITGWIISIKVGKYGLLLIGLGIFPMLFSKKDKFTNLGKLLFALGMVFFGLKLMGDAFKPLRSNEEFISMLSVFSADTWYSILACFGVGMVLTMIIQSSSAMLGITIALATQGVITFETAAALVLGENIGTTITLWLASIGAQRITKRVALSHSFFNVLGCFVAFLIFKPYINFIDWLVAGDPAMIAEDGTLPYIAIHIASVHTFFNVTMTLLFLPFLQYLQKLVTLVFPDVEKEDEDTKLIFFKAPVAASPELAIGESILMINRMGAIVKESISDAKTYLTSKETNDKLFKKIMEDEDTVDRMQYEITIFLNNVINTSLTQAQSETIKNMIRVSDELESVSDYCQSIAKYKKRMLEKNEKCKPETMDVLSSFMDKVQNFFNKALGKFSVLDQSPNDSIIYEYANLNNEADKIRETHIGLMQKQFMSPTMSLIFSDIMIALRRIKNHSLNIAEAVIGGKGEY